MCHSFPRLVGCKTQLKTDGNTQTKTKDGAWKMVLPYGADTPEAAAPYGTAAGESCDPGNGNRRQPSSTSDL